MEKQLRGKKVAILAYDGVEETEILEPAKALRESGATIVVVGPKEEALQMMRHDVKSGTIQVDLEMKYADANLFDAVLLPGGALNADALRMDEFARDFVREMDKQKKPFAVICHAPWLLVSAGLVNRRTLTSYYTIQDDIKNAGGKWLDREVVKDKNWVTSRMPSDIPAFNEAMIELFSDTNKQAVPSSFTA